MTSVIALVSADVMMEANPCAGETCPAKHSTYTGMTSMYAYFGAHETGIEVFKLILALSKVAPLEKVAAAFAHDKEFVLLVKNLIKPYVLNRSNIMEATSKASARLVSLVGEDVYGDDLLRVAVSELVKNRSLMAHLSDITSLVAAVERILAENHDLIVKETNIPLAKEYVAIFTEEISNAVLRWIPMILHEDPDMVIKATKQLEPYVGAIAALFRPEGHQASIFAENRYDRCTNKAMNMMDDIRLYWVSSILNVKNEAEFDKVYDSLIQTIRSALRPSGSAGGKIYPVIPVSSSSDLPESSLFERVIGFFKFW